MNDGEILIYLSSINGIGWSTLNKLNSLEPYLSILELSPLEISLKTGIEYSLAEIIIQKLTNKDFSSFRDKLREWKNNGIKIVTFFDKEYPEVLKEIYQPPWVLYLKGNEELLYKRAISVVGTRMATTYGRIVTEKLTKELVESGFVVISGLARGIDSIVHKQAIMSNGDTIAVLGNGIDMVYPKENLQLYHEINQKGLIISEYPVGVKPHPAYFPQRNRIISGLSLGTIVIEASEKSGSLITAQYALEQSREVFAVPGPITSKQSIGTNSLIKQGAKLVQNISDILEEFPYISPNIKEYEKTKLNNTEEKVYNLIHLSPIHIDDIYSKAGYLNLSDLYEALLSLQLKGLIKQLPGGLYIRQ